jgi:hypothetical protein
MVKFAMDCIFLSLLMDLVDVSIYVSCICECGIVLFPLIVL